MSILGQMIYDDGKKAGLEEGKSVGLAEGKAAATESTQLNAIQALMRNLKMTAEQAMSALNVPEVEWGKYSSLL